MNPVSADVAHVLPENVHFGCCWIVYVAGDLVAYLKLLVLCAFLPACFLTTIMSAMHVQLNRPALHVQTTTCLIERDDVHSCFSGCDLQTSFPTQREPPSLSRASTSIWARRQSASS